MSTTVNLKANATGVARVSTPSQSYTPGSEYVIENQNDQIFFTFAQPSSSYNYNVIEKVAFCANKTDSTTYSVQLKISAVKKSFNISSVTINNSPAVDTSRVDVISISASPSEKEISNRLGFNDAWAQVITNGLRAVPYSSTYVGQAVYTSASALYAPFLKVTFSDTKVHLEPTGSPRSGYVDPRADITLRWSNSRVPAFEPSMAEPTQLIAIVTWKEADDETTVHQLQTSTETSVTIPADTWALNKNYMWKVAVTDEGGTTTDSGWYTLTTTEPQATPPTLVEPDGVTLDGSEPIQFRWIDNGRGTYKGTDISISGDNGASWGDPIFVGEGLTSYAMPGNTLTAGNKLWRARSYNPSMTPGEWSESLPFTVIAPPLTPYMEVTSVSPRPVVTWESDEQLAYQVQMGSYDSGLRFGLDHTFQCPEFLPDGQTTIRVRVMNQYNLWSDWANTSINIENKPGFSTPTLTVAQSQDALLSWTEVKSSTPISGLTWEIGKTISGTGGLSNSAGFCRSGYFDLDGAALVANGSPARDTDGNAYTALIAFYNGSTFLSRGTLYRYGTTPPEGATRARIVFGYTSSQGIAATQETADAFIGYLGSDDPAPVIVYRNGTQIAETDGLTYTDRWANGPTTYMVRAILGGDNYVDSNTVEINLETQHPMIAEPGGPWLELRYTTDAVHNTQTTVQQTVTLMQFSGSVYPEAEAAPYRQRSRQISVAFLNGQERAFEALLGRECVLKDQYGGVIYGIMSSMSKMQNQFYCVISATIQQLEGEP